MNTDDIKAQLQAQLIEVLALGSISEVAPAAPKKIDVPDSDELHQAVDLRRGLEGESLGEDDRRVIQRSLDILEASENQTNVFRGHIDAFIDRHSLLSRLGLPEASREEVIESLREALGRVSLAFRGKMSRALRRSGQAELSIRRENGAHLVSWKGEEGATESNLREVLVAYLEPAFLELDGLADAPAAVRTMSELLTDDLTLHKGLLPTFAPPVPRDDEVVLAWRSEVHPAMQPDRVEVALNAKAPELASLLDEVRFGRCVDLPNIDWKVPDLAAVEVLVSNLSGVTGVSVAACSNYVMRIVSHRFQNCAVNGDEKNQARMADLHSVVQKFHTGLGED